MQALLAFAALESAADRAAQLAGHDGADEARRLVAAHAAEHGCPDEATVDRLASEAAATAAAEAARIERQCVEEVFCLGGGELYDTAWEAVDVDGEPAPQRYWYCDPPEYAGADFDDKHTAEYRTVVCCCLFGMPDEELFYRGRKWTRVGSYTSSGEAECRAGQDGDGVDHAVTDERCPHCAEAKGDAHGYIYLGDGWAEVVYRAEDEPEETDEEECEP